MNDEERLQKIMEILDELSELATDHVLLVEGKNDMLALENLGISGKSFMIQSEGGPLKAAEYVASHGGKAVILTDWDRKGGIISSEISAQLSSLGVRYNTDVRARLSLLCKKYIKDVESLDVLVGRLADITGMIY